MNDDKIQILYLERKLFQAQKEMETFKDAIGRRAMNLAHEHGWCSEVTQALEDLGIPLPDMTKNLELTIKVYVTATPGSDEWLQSADFIDRSLQDISIEMDDDWSNVEVTGWDLIDSSYHDVR